MNYSELSTEEQQEAKVYMKVIVYFMRNGGMQDRDCYRRCIYVSRQLLPYSPGSRRTRVLEYIKSFMDEETPLEEKIVRLQRQLEEN